jgi:hypothetical protein
MLIYDQVFLLKLCFFQIQWPQRKNEVDHNFTCKQYLPLFATDMF